MIAIFSAFLYGWSLRYWVLYLGFGALCLRLGMAGMFGLNFLIVFNGDAHFELSRHVTRKLSRCFQVHSFSQATLVNSLYLGVSEVRYAGRSYWRFTFFNDVTTPSQLFKLLSLLFLSALLMHRYVCWTSSSLSHPQSFSLARGTTVCFNYSAFWSFSNLASSSSSQLVQPCHPTTQPVHDCRFAFQLLRHCKNHLVIKTFTLLITSAHLLAIWDYPAKNAHPCWPTLWVINDAWGCRTSAQAFVLISFGELIHIHGVTAIWIITRLPHKTGMIRRVERLPSWVIRDSARVRDQLLVQQFVKFVNIVQGRNE